MRSFRVLSALLVATTVVHGLSISGNYVCDTGSGCSGELLDVASDTDFSLQCADASSCERSQIVVHSGCTLKQAGIDCSLQFACRYATIDVYSSDLTTHPNGHLNCYNPSSGGLCKEMNMTLVDSSIVLYCGSNDCDSMQVHLFGSSTLELKAGTACSTTSSRVLTIYLYDDSQLIDNGVNCPNLVYITDPPTSTSTMTPTSSTTLLPTSTSTTMTPTASTVTPSTTSLTTSTTRPTTPPLTTPIPQTSRPIPNSTHSNKSTTEIFITTSDGKGGGGGNSSIIIYGAGAGAVFVVVVLVVVAICCCRRKRGESKSDGHQQIPATSAPAKADSIEESREVVPTYIQSDNEDENPEEKDDLLVTPGGPSVASDVDLEESSVSSILSEGQVPTRA